MNAWNPLVLSLLLAPLLAPLLASGAPQGEAQPAQETQAKPSDAARSARLDAVLKELDDATKAFRAAVAAAKTDEERRAIKGPDPAAYVPRVWEIVRESPRDATALTALTWLIEESRSETDRDQAIAAIAKDHLESPSLASLCSTLGENQQIGTDLLELLVTSNPDRNVKGRALYAIASHRLESARTARRLKGEPAEGIETYKKFLGPTRTAELLRLDPAEADTEAAGYLERVIREFGDVKARNTTLESLATADLRELRELTVGKVAPEIAAEDLDGVAFRLSDYRGKVVLLDFWGNW
jgi:hypothetical protein